MSIPPELNKALMDALVALIAAVVPILATLAGNLIMKKIKATQTQADDRLAAVAVSWAEDKIGSGQGALKLNNAVVKLIELSKGRINRENAEVLVRTAYQNLFGALKPLKNG